MLSLNSDGLNDDRLEQALSNVPQQAIVLLEDVDAAFVQRSSGERHGGGVSFSGLLNALDGIGDTTKGTLFLFTTNFPDKLDTALRRKGRIDREFYVGPCSEEQARDMYMPTRVPCSHIVTLPYYYGPLE